jgi:GTP cyclohydrolase I
MMVDGRKLKLCLYLDQFQERPRRIVPKTGDRSFVGWVSEAQPTRGQGLVTGGLRPLTRTTKVGTMPSVVPLVAGYLRMSTNSARQSLSCLGNGGLAITSAHTEAELDDLEPQVPQPPGPGSPTMDLDRIRRAVREILLAVGEDPEREGLRETPDRVARMYAEVFQGLGQDPRLHLKKLFTQKYDEMVLIRDIRFVSFCEHHLLPVIGKAHVAYLPNGKVIGLSKIPRVLDVLSRRPQMQERLTEELADLLMKELDAKGVAVVIEASHSCMTIRGVNKPDSSFVTSAMRGTFKERLATRSEVMSLIFGSKT